MIDEKTIKEIISDYEFILGIVTKNLKILKNMVSVPNGEFKTPTNFIENDVKTKIETERKRLLAEAQKIREQAQLQAQQAMGGVTSGFGTQNVGFPMGGIPGVPNMGVGMPNMSAGFPMDNGFVPPTGTDPEGKNEKK